MKKKAFRKLTHGDEVIYNGETWLAGCHQPMTKGLWISKPPRLKLVMRHEIELPEPAEQTEKQPNPHAALKEQYAKDASWHPRPWELWRSRNPSTSYDWTDLNIAPGFYAEMLYSRKPLIINGITVPEPERMPLKNGRRYYAPSVYGIEPSFCAWANRDLDTKRLRAGLIHLTKEAAQIHLDALLSFTRVPE